MNLVRIMYVAGSKCMLRTPTPDTGQQAFKFGEAVEVSEAEARQLCKTKHFSLATAVNPTAKMSPAELRAKRKAEAEEAKVISVPVTEAPKGSAVEESISEEAGEE